MKSEWETSEKLYELKPCYEPKHHFGPNLGLKAQSLNRAKFTLCFFSARRPRLCGLIAAGSIGLISNLSRQTWSSEQRYQGGLFYRQILRIHWKSHPFLKNAMKRFFETVSHSIRSIPDFHKQDGNNCTIFQRSSLVSA